MRTRVGYTGGTTKNPNYDNIGDHTETLQLDFDPTKITYSALLDIFWNTHNHCKTPYSRQYMSAVFVHNEGQRQLALNSRARHAKEAGQKITTDILPLGPFYLAEDYHQKYMLRQRRELYREFRAIYPSESDFMASTAVARVNSYLGGNGTVEQLTKELPSLGLSPANSQLLSKLIR